jgi:TonB family protein
MTQTALANLAAWGIQVGVLAALSAVLTRLVFIDAPAVRYAWWRTVLAAALALPLLQPWHPAGTGEPPVVALDETRMSPAVDGPSSSSGSTRSAGRTPARPPSWPAIVSGVLITGALFRLAWLGAGLIRLRSMRGAGTPADVSDTPDVSGALADAGAEVRYVRSLSQPLTFGVTRPVVLLPESVRGMSAGVRRAVLAHELWHVRRRDWLWSLGEEALRAVLWFHPAISYLVSRVQSAREEVVDELSILSTNARKPYLEALLAFADEPAVYPAAPFIRRRQLFNRMLLISREGVMSSKRILASCAGIAGALVVTGWYGTQAFPLTATNEGTAAAIAQSQTQPRDPRAGAERPATSREQELQTATGADPANATNWLELAKLQEARGAIAEAEKTYETALTGTSGSQTVRMSLARFLTRNGQFDKAVGILEDAAARNPGDPSGHQLVATYYWEKAQKDVSLTPADKLMYLESGIRATDLALAHRPDYVEALTYKNIMLRMKAGMETDAARRQQLLNEANTLRARAMALATQRSASGVPLDPSAPPPPPPPPPPPAGSYDVDGQPAVRVGGEIPPPSKIRDVRPVYPAEATAAKVSGTVVVDAVIDAKGVVRRVTILKSIPMLDLAVVEAVEQWRFTPTVRDGVAIPVVMTLPVNFAL